MIKSPKVIFIGGGPVGLYTAILTALHNSDIALHHPENSDILILEHYPEYQRKHPLKLNKKSFQGIPDLPGFQEFKNLMLRLPKKIATNELEDILLNYAKKVGITIQYTHIAHEANIQLLSQLPDQATLRQLKYNYILVDNKDLYYIGLDGNYQKIEINDIKALSESLATLNPSHLTSIRLSAKQFEKFITKQSGHELNTCEKIAKDYKDAEVIVGTDGAHSVVHQEIFNNDYEINERQKFIVEVKYHIEGKGRELYPIQELPLALKHSNHLVTEFVGEEKNGRTPVSLRFFLHEEEYEAMNTMDRRKNPLTLNDARIPNTVKQSIHHWLTARKNMTAEKKIENSVRLTTTNLDIYTSKEYIKQCHGKTFIKVGDALFGVPYYRSLNNGILCGIKAAKTIHAILTKQNIEKITLKSIVEKITPKQYYRHFVKELIKKEVATARQKTLGITFGQSVASSLQSLPSPASTEKIAFSKGNQQFKMEMRREHILHPDIKKIITELVHYTNIFKLSIFGHHHDKRARAVIRAIKSTDNLNEIKTILSNQSYLMEQSVAYGPHKPLPSIVTTGLFSRFTHPNKLINKINPSKLHQSGYYKAILAGLHCIEEIEKRRSHPIASPGRESAAT